jgi:hypothetical protein
MGTQRNGGVTVPNPYPASTFFLDESGTKATDTFVIAGLKVRHPGALARDVKDLRDRHGVQHELKFGGITRDSLPMYYDLVDLLERSDAHLVGCVVVDGPGNPFKDHDHRWQAHAEVAARLLAGCINRRELACAVMDGISTPRGCALDDTVKRIVNERLTSTSLISAVCLDSKSNDLLQIADMIASSVRFERRRAAGKGGHQSSPKGKVATRLGAAFGNPGLRDLRRGRCNLAPYRPPAERDEAPMLKSV